MWVRVMFVIVCCGGFLCGGFCGFLFLLVCLVGGLVCLLLFELV